MKFTTSTSISLLLLANIAAVDAWSWGGWSWGSSWSTPTAAPTSAPTAAPKKTTTTTATTKSTKATTNHNGWDGWNGWNTWDQWATAISAWWEELQCADDHLLQCSGRVGTIYGDPHINTFDGVSTDCQAEGEFVLVNSPGNIQIQSRFEMLAHQAVSVTTGIAAQVSDHDIIQVSFAEFTSGQEFSVSRGTCGMHLYVNGAIQDANSISGNGYSVSIGRSSVDIQFFDGNTPTYAITIQAASIHSNTACMMNAYFCLPSDLPEVLGATVGLLGSPNCEDSDEWMTAEGDPLTYSRNSQDEYDYCTSHHCVYKETQSLFTHEDAHGGKSFSDLFNCDADFQGEIDISNPDPEILEICGADDMECILDGMVTGEQGAVSSAGVQDTMVAIHVSNTTVDTEPDMSCPGDITLLHTHGETAYEQIPLTIVEQNVDNAVLKFRTSMFAGVSSLFVQYIHDFHDICLSEQDVSTSFSEDFTISCPSSEKFAIVNVIVADDGLSAEGDDAEIPLCCHATDDDDTPKVKYTFMVSCISQCKDEASRRLRGTY